MKITCPECATRYDLEDDRFLPNGRSVRCTACGESWFVPAPESIEALSADKSARPERPERQRHDRDRDEEDQRAPARETGQKRRARFGVPDASGREDEGDDDDEKGFMPPRDEKGRFLPREARRRDEERRNARDAHDDDRQSRRNAYDDDDVDYHGDHEGGDENDDDDALFDTPIMTANRKAKADKAGRREDADNRETPPKGWRKGKQFYVEDDDDDDHRGDGPRGPAAFFAKRKSSKRDDHKASRDDARRDGLRFAEDDFEEDFDRAPRRKARNEARSEARRDYDDYDDYDDELSDDDIIVPAQATIVDADWEDVEADSAQGKNFGRRVREERRRSTALARMEDVRRFEPEMFDDQFFASLRVTPRELERAVSKARRRAESREKNRMTPWRAFGWSAWVAAIAGAAYAVVAYRDEIVKVAPTAAEAYAVVGIETDPFGLKIENVRHRLAMSTGGPMIEITGSLRNAGAQPLDAPLLQAEALGPRGELLSRWTFQPDQSTVAGSDKVEFVTRAAAPEGVSEVALSFAPAETAVTALRAEQD